MANAVNTQQMGHVDRMADAGANASGDQVLLAMTGQNLRQASELRRAEACAGEFVEREPGAKQKQCGDPAPRAVIERQVAPVCGNGGQEQPHCDPRRQQDSIWGTRTGAPIFHAGMYQQPEAGYGRIDDAADPADGLQCVLHTLDSSGLAPVTKLRASKERRASCSAPEVHRLSFHAGDLVKILRNSQHPHRA
jgi:hypothetical protein